MAGHVDQPIKPERNIIKRGRLKPEHEDAITKYYTYLKDELDPKYIIDILVSKRVLDHDDKEEVLMGRPRKDQADVLLRKILNAGPGDAFMIFLKALESEGYEHIAQKLKEHIDTKKEVGKVFTVV